MINSLCNLSVRRMCGINGIINNHGKNKSSRRIIRRMNKAILHRGPDGEGIFVSKSRHAAFGFRRLAIVDVKNGAQPIEIAHGKHEYAVVCNGEIYNHDELRKELRCKGYSFKTHSDTEVLLSSYIEWGEECLQRFNGAFAFAIYDGVKDSIFMARDRVGIKPLFYSILKNGTLIFSSEPKGILAYPGFPREPDNETIAEFFVGTHSLPDGCAPLDRSFFKGIRSLLPGTHAYFKDSILTTKLYWDISINKANKPDHVEKLKKQLEKAIDIRIPREVKFGTALSGGLDSSIVTSVVKEHGFDALSTCVRFSDSKHNPDYEHAERLSKQKNIQLLPTDLAAEKIISFIDPMIMAMDEPHDALRQLSLFAVYKTLQKAGCKVALVGEGSDEFNMGYFHSYPGFHIDRETCKDSEAFRAALKSKLPQLSQYFTKGFLDSVDFEKLIDFKVTNYFDRCKSSDPMDQMQYFYIKKFLKYRLDANDRCSMAHSVEARVPFCDHNVVEVSLQIPNELNLKQGTEKYALREAFRRLLPDYIVERRKYPFPENEELRLYSLLALELDNQIESAAPGIWKILDKRSAIALNQRFKSKINDLEHEGDVSELTKEVPMGKNAGIKVKHVFSVLTLMRWYQIYFP